MKKHFGRQVIEAARRNSGAKSGKARYYGKIMQDADGYDYDGPMHLPSSRHPCGYLKKLEEKSLSDKLGPLTKYLRSSCGRPWNDVYSELRRELGRSGSEGVRHIVDSHIHVDINTWRGRSGTIYADTEYGVHRVEGGYRSGDFYVEPETGILRETALAKSRKQIAREKTRAGLVYEMGPYGTYTWRKPTAFKFGAGSIEKYDGIWYYIETVTHDHKVFLCLGGLDGKTEYYRIEKVVDHSIKRQLDSKELQQHELRNDVSTRPVKRRRRRQRF